MSRLQTSAENLNALDAAGYKLYRTCNCAGTYWEKFKNKATGQKIHLAPFKGFFLHIADPNPKHKESISQLITYLNTQNELAKIEEEEE